MKIYPIPFSFVEGRVPFSWRDLLWGYERQFVGWSFIVDFANAKLNAESSELEVELSMLDKTEAFRVGELIRILACNEEFESDGKTVEKWLYIILEWVFTHRDCIEDAFSQVEEIYAEFDYPSEIANFVRYMPVTDGFNPALHTKEECDDRLIENWAKYLHSASIKFACGRGSDYRAIVTIQPE